MPPPVLENPEHQTKWYSRYFLGKFHRNYVGQDATDAKSIYALSGYFFLHPLVSLFLQGL